eukprot:365798-Chlamydomonas_euryale.AAC.5
MAGATGRTNSPPRTRSRRARMSWRSPWRGSAMAAGALRDPSRSSDVQSRQAFGGCVKARGPCMCRLLNQRPIPTEMSSWLCGLGPPVHGWGSPVGGREPPNHGLQPPGSGWEPSILPLLSATAIVMGAAVIVARAVGLQN